MIFEFWSNLFDIQIFQIIHIYDRMWISHRNSSDVVSSSINIQWLIDYLLFCGNHRNLSGSQNWCAHVNLNKSNFSIITQSQVQIFNTALSSNRNIRFIYNAVIVGIFCHTANSVSAHGTLRAVQVIHIHFTVCHIGWLDQNQSVRSDSEVTVADKFCDSRRITYSFFKAVYIYIIVSDSMHFGKFHKNKSSSFK